jgi:hypothetical protein
MCSGATGRLAEAAEQGYRKGGERSLGLLAGLKPSRYMREGQALGGAEEFFEFGFGEDWDV